MLRNRNKKKKDTTASSTFKKNNDQSSLKRKKRKGKKSSSTTTNNDDDDFSDGRKHSKSTTHHQEPTQILMVAITFMGILSAIGMLYSLKWRQNLLASSGTTTSANGSSKPYYVHKLNDDDAIVELQPLWNTSDSTLNETNNFLTDYICNEQTDNAKDTKSFCHYRMRAAPERRTNYIAHTKKNESLRKRETILILPRRFLVWDLDAMRDDFVQKELMSARHEGTSNPIDSGAFLAAHLIRRLKVGRGLWQGEEGKSSQEDDTITTENNKRLIEYLNILPTYEQYQKTHPTLWSEKDLVNLFGQKTPTFELIKGYQNMMHSEYSAFCKVSSLFQDNVDQKDYITMRLNVVSRSFGPGPPGSEEEIEWGMNGETNLNGELEYYEQKAGVVLKKGLRAMSPILDMWDHHAQPNVNWNYNRALRAFEITVAKGGIKPGHDIMVSYGKYTDTHLFSKFGFVNGDGSGHTEASIAVLHRLLDVGMGQQFSYLNMNLDDNTDDDGTSSKDLVIQKRNVLQYLVFDDGYNTCIEEENNPDGFTLKKLKFQYLQKIANIRDRWTITMPPRNPTSKPTVNSSIPITTEPPRFDPKKVTFDGSKLISTCRLLVLTNDDFDGKAVEVLSNVLKNNTVDQFLVPRQSDYLEFRALTYLARLTTMALKQYNTEVPKDMRLLTPSFPQAAEFCSKEWLAAHVRLGEMQTLEVLRSISSSGARQMYKQFQNIPDVKSLPATHIRHVPCPVESMTELL